MLVHTTSSSMLNTHCMQTVWLLFTRDTQSCGTMSGANVVGDSLLWLLPHTLRNLFACFECHALISNAVYNDHYGIRHIKSHHRRGSDVAG